MASLKNMGKWFRDAGLTVVEMPGWQSRANESGRFAPIGIMWHHDGMGLGFNKDPKDDYNVPKNMSRPGSYGSQIWISNDGVVVLVAAGRMPHAGIGSWKGYYNRGNELFVGIETDHTIGNPWPNLLLKSLRTVNKVLAKKMKWNPDNSCGHKEYAPGRKTDPERLDMNLLRANMREDLRKKRKFTPAPIDFPVGIKYFGKSGTQGFKNEKNKKEHRKAIRWIQRRLKQLGYVSTARWVIWTTIPAQKGRFRKSTINRITQWQAEHYSRFTGRPGEVWPDDWDRLNNPDCPGKGD